MAPLTREAIFEMTGHLSDRQLSAILALAPSEAELLAAVAWIGADDALRREKHAVPSGKAAALVEILTVDEPSPEEERG